MFSHCVVSLNGYLWLQVLQHFFKEMMLIDLLVLQKQKIEEFLKTDSLHLALFLKEPNCLEDPQQKISPFFTEHSPQLHVTLQKFFLRKHIMHDPHLALQRLPASD